MTGARDYYGAHLGPLSQLEHGVSGDVYAVDSRTLFIKNFNYDGEGPGKLYNFLLIILIIFFLRKQNRSDIFILRLQQLWCQIKKNCRIKKRQSFMYGHMDSVISNVKMRNGSTVTLTAHFKFAYLINEAEETQFKIVNS